MIRYALHDTAALRDRFSLGVGLPKGVRPYYNIAPATTVSTIVTTDGVRNVTPMTWGLVPKGSTNTNSIFRYKTYTTPSEKLLSRHSWEAAVRHNRCIVPANGYYELLGKGSEQRAYYIRATNSPLIGFAGIYTEWTDKAGTPQRFVSILTINTAPGALPGDDTMPIILSESEESRWLDTSLSDVTNLYDMLRQYPVNQLTVEQVGPEVHSKKFNQPSAVTPLAP